MSDLVIRPAKVSDRSKLVSFLNFQNRIHRHLDWRAPLDWLDYQPFLIAENQGEIEAVFACPPDPPQIAWIRIFASSNRISTQKAWEILTQEAVSMLKSESTEFRLVALALEDWFEELLIKENFFTKQDIVVLEWDGRIPAEKVLPDSFSIRKMNIVDLPVVKELDRIAFDPLWHNSLDSLTLAFQQSSSSTVALINDRIVGYQISSAMPFSGHLARLAVDPLYQGQYIGYNLVYSLIKEFKKLGIWQVTVNTQNNNYSSLALYDKIGFRRTGEVFRVYEYPIWKSMD